MSFIRPWSTHASSISSSHWTTTSHGPCRHSVASGFTNSVGDVEEIFESTAGGDVDDEALLPGDHQPGGEGGADVVTSQTDAVDHVPGVDGVHVPELLASVGEDRVDSSVGVVHQNVQLSVLF